MSSQFHAILLLLTVFETKATLFPKKFKKLETGKSITGQIGAELMTRSKLQCSDRYCKFSEFRESDKSLKPLKIGSLFGVLLLLWFLTQEMTVQLDPITVLK